MRVAIYFNLHKRCFSLRAEEGPLRGIVIGHATAVTLDKVTCHVGAAGQAMVRKTGVKNVHAFLRGDLSGLAGFTPTARAVAENLELNTPKVEAISRELMCNCSAFGYDPYVDYGFTSRTETHRGTYICAARGAYLATDTKPMMLEPELLPVPA